jgi:hypothetical protein
MAKAQSRGAHEAKERSELERTARTWHSSQIRRAAKEIAEFARRAIHSKQQA